MANPFCHIELHANNPGAAKEFYSQLFDWKLEDMPMPDGNYTMINVGDGTGGGIMMNPVPDAPSHWLAYVLVDDIAASIEKAKAIGATILLDKNEIPNFGWYSVIQDPTGAALGLWQPMKQ